MDLECINCYVEGVELLLLYCGRLTSRKPLWLDLQPVDIKSRWRHNWKSAQVVNSDLKNVRPHNPATRFQPPLATVVSVEPFSHGTGTLRCLQKEIATYRH